MSIRTRQSMSEPVLSDVPHHEALTTMDASEQGHVEQPISILLVDDEPKNLMVLESVLHDPRYRLVCAGSGNEALLELVHGEFALLILDIHMPEMNGFELAQMIKQRKKTASVPIIFLSAFYNDDQHILEGYSTGAVDYLHKPINPVILRSKVAVFAELYQKTRALSASNRTLLAEITERKLAQEKLYRLTTELEERVAERTATLAQANAALVESDERLQMAQAAGGVGVWDWDIVANETFWSESMWLIHGIEPIAPAQVQEHWRSLLHPDDRERVLHSLEALLASTEDLFRCEYRVVGSDKVTRWVENVASVTRDDSGAAVRMSGVNVDLTERKRTADRLRLSEERFRLALKNSHILVYTTDRQRRYTWTSGPYPDFLPDDVIGRRDEELFSPEKAAPLIALKERVLASGVGEHGGFAIEIDGITREYDLTVEPLTDDGGTPVGLTVAAMEITELKRAEAALRIADRRKDEFLATLAHELRNPLAPIRTAVEILRHESTDAGELEWARDVIDRQAQQLTRLVDDLLDVSRITTGKLALRMEPLELSKVVHLAIETSRPLIEQRRHDLQLDLPSGKVVVKGDATRLAQVLANLLNNAAKYTDPGGSIRLSAQVQGNLLEISIKDSGIGIPAPMLPFVFDLFAQGDRHLERSHGGLGVGLTLVKRLVELHSGSIEARSAGVRAGSEFVVRLPLALDHTVVEAKKDRVMGQAAARPLRILVVDDNRDNAICLRMMLDLAGHETRTSYDGLEALEAAEAFRPQVILLDIGMPKLNGYEVCSRIRNEAWGAGMVLIAQTGWGQDEDRRRTQAAGFDHHLVKPVKQEALMEILAECGAAAPTT